MLFRSVLAHYARDWLIGVEDISAFVREQCEQAQLSPYAQLVTPRERRYPVLDETVALRVGISATEMPDNEVPVH